MAEKRKKVLPQTSFVPINVLLVSLSLGDNRVLSDELVGSMGKELAVPEFTTFELALEFQIPVLGDVLRLGDTLLFRAHAEIPTVNERRALPVAAVIALVDVESASHQDMLNHPVFYLASFTHN